MLQRVQSLLLGLVALFHVLLFFIPVFAWNNAGGEVIKITALFNPPFIVVNVVVILFSIFIITQFKNRKKQRSYTLILAIIIVLYIGLGMVYMIKFTFQNEYVLLPGKSLGIYLQLISIILCYVAARRIKKDDDLVKSIDRIR